MSLGIPLEAKRTEGTRRVLRMSSALQGNFLKVGPYKFFKQGKTNLLRQEWTHRFSCQGRLSRIYKFRAASFIRMSPSHYVPIPIFKFPFLPNYALILAKETPA